MGIPEGSLAPDILRKLLENQIRPSKLSPKQREVRKKFETTKPKAPRPPKQKELLFNAICIQYGLPVPDHEYRFNELSADPVINPQTGKPYQWRFDYLFDGLVAVERVGGVWVHGHHSRGQDQIDDMHKRNCAVFMGFLPLEFTPDQFDSGAAFEFIGRVLKGESS